MLFFSVLFQLTTNDKKKRLLLIILGHVLFPGPQRRFATSTGSTFIPFPNASKAQPIARPEQNGTLRSTGKSSLPDFFQ